MRSKNLGYLFLTLALGFAGTLLVIGLVDVSAAFAQEQTGDFSVQRQPPPPDDSDLLFIAFFTDELGTEITDLSGVIVGTGTLEGKLRCHVGNCSQKVQLSFDSSKFEYKFTSEQALDPVERRLVLAGTGTIDNQGNKERFTFSATIQDNRDGTIRVLIEASRQDASFIIPKAPGRMEFRFLR